MKIHVYVFRERSALIDPEKFHPIDDHLIRAMHIESIYDVYQYVGCYDLAQLHGLGADVVSKLKRYGEVVLRGEAAKRIARMLKLDMTVKFVVLRLER